MEKKEFISSSPSDTWDIGERIAKDAKQGDLYALYGELGAWKTQFVKGLARGIGVRDWQHVVSPSFTIMNLYEGALNLCHVDLYRIERDEVGDFELERFLETGVVVIEWAERAAWPEGTIKVNIEVISEEERKIVIT